MSGTSSTRLDERRIISQSAPLGIRGSLLCCFKKMEYFNHESIAVVFLGDKEFGGEVQSLAQRS
jgi:hypothetical protein